MNADDQIHLWVNNRLIEFDAAQYRRDGVAIPTFSPEDAGDAEPVGIGVAAGLEVDATRLKILRDIYYTSRKGGQVLHSSLSNESGMNEFEIQQIQRDPESWTGKTALKYFTEKKGETDPMFKLKRGETAEQDQFLPMGDNSPESLDGRVWDGEKYVERRHVNRSSHVDLLAAYTQFTHQVLSKLWRDGVYSVVVRFQILVRCD